MDTAKALSSCRIPNLVRKMCEYATTLSGVTLSSLSCRRCYRKEPAVMEQERFSRSSRYDIDSFQKPAVAQWPMEEGDRDLQTFICDCSGFRI